MRMRSGDVDPWEAPDPALALALQELKWYRRNMDKARTANQVSEIILLMTSAVTTLAAALAATPWVTAVLAAVSLVLGALRKSFDWHESWVSFASRWSELRSAVHEYRLLPEDRRNEEARHHLVTRVDGIVNAETERWASRRRSLVEENRR